MSSLTFNLIISSILALNTYYGQLYESQDKADFHGDSLKLPTLNFPQHSKEYDYIVVGAGSAGCVVASKLAEKNYHVLLLEAGGNQIPYTYPLGTNNFLREEPTITFNFTSQFQPRTFRANNGIVRMMTGRLMGGSSSINGMVYNRGSPKDYDNWARLTRDPAWRYRNVEKFFKMSEDFRSAGNGHLGKNGPIPLYLREDNSEESFWMTRWNEAGRELGYATGLNFNDPQREGMGTVLHNRDKNNRVSNYDAFIKPILDRGNKHLVIERYANVEKIDIDETGKAIGVIYKRHGVIQMAKTKKEIIISAGTFNSPLILIKSGIGNKIQLQENEIPVVKDLPVGRYLDHQGTILYGIKYNKPKNTSKTFNSDIEKNEFSANDPFGRVMGMLSQGVFSSSFAKDGWPDIQMERATNSREIFSGRDEIILGVANERPKSVGSLKYSKESSLPIWNPNVFSDPDNQDIKVVIEGIRILENILNTTAMRRIGVTWNKESHRPNTCRAFQMNSDEYWECYIRHHTGLWWHPVGSCHMGSSQTNSVVDSKLRVWGIKGLRVIDNSIQPAIVNTNTHAAATMIGQFGADAILKTV